MNLDPHWMKTVGNLAKLGYGLEQSPTVMVGEKQQQFPIAPMGVLAPGSAHARPSAQPPIDTSGNFSAHMSAE